MNNAHYSLQLSDWYDTPSGRKFKKQIQANVRELTRALPGTQHAQVVVGEWPSLKKHSLCLHYDDVFATQVNPDVLPNSMEVLTLVNCLDVESDPQRVLHIADKLVSKSGYLVIVGFNPTSYMGFLRLGLRFRQRAPWKKGWRSAPRVTDWLKVLNYQVEVHSSTMALTELQRNDASLGVVKRVMHWLLPKWGGAYILVAKRPWYPMTGLFSRKPKKKKSMVPLAEPSARELEEL